MLLEEESIFQPFGKVALSLRRGDHERVDRSAASFRMEKIRRKWKEKSGPARDTEGKDRRREKRSEKERGERAVVKQRGKEGKREGERGKEREILAVESLA